MAFQDALKQKELSERVAHRRHMRELEGDFLNRVQSNKVFLRLLGLLSKRTGMSVEDLHALVDEICKLCWSEADLTLTAGEQDAPMRAQVKRLKQQMNECNLTAQRQIEHIRCGGYAEGKHSDDTQIHFYEPLQYLDEATRDLVLSLVLDKVKLVEGGNAPPSLVEAITKHATKRATCQAPASFPGTPGEQLSSALEKLQEVTEELTEARAMQTDAEEVSKGLRQQLRDLKEEERKAPELQDELKQLRRRTVLQEEEASAKALEIKELRAKVEFEGEDIKQRDSQIEQMERFCGRRCGGATSSRDTDFSAEEAEEYYVWTGTQQAIDEFGSSIKKASKRAVDEFGHPKRGAIVAETHKVTMEAHGGIERAATNGLIEKKVNERAEEYYEWTGTQQAIDEFGNYVKQASRGPIGDFGNPERGAVVTKAQKITMGAHGGIDRAATKGLVEKKFDEKAEEYYLWTGAQQAIDEFGSYVKQASRATVNEFGNPKRGAIVTKSQKVTMEAHGGIEGAATKGLLEKKVSTCGVQTDVLGDQIENHQKEIKKYKVMLEELHSKFKELMDKCKKKGLPQEDCEEMIQNMGLQEVFTCRAVFHRLYEDAQKRADRLEGIRAQLKIERERTMAGLRETDESTSPKASRWKQVRRLMVDEAGEVPVLQAVEMSPLKGLQRFSDKAEAIVNGSEPPRAPGGWEARVDSPPIPAGLPLNPPSPSSKPQPDFPCWVVTPLRGRQDSQDASPLRRRPSAGAVAKCAVFVSKLKMKTSHSLPSLPASGVVSQRLEAANAPLEAVFETRRLVQSEAKSTAQSPKSIRKLLS